MRRPGRFDREVEIHAPSARERRDILYVHLKTMKHDISEEQLTMYVDSIFSFNNIFLFKKSVIIEFSLLPPQVG